MSKSVKNFQRRNFNYYGEALEVDGNIGPETQWSLDMESQERFRRIVVACATGYVGEKEIPIGSNRGAFVDRVLAPAKVGFGLPWCCAFVSFVLSRALCPFSDYYVSVKQMWDGEYLRRTECPLPGDVFCIVRPDGTGHTGLVIGVDSDEIMTIEGNVRHCVKVGRRDRSKITGYLSLEKAFAKNPTVSPWVADLDGEEDR